MVGSTPDWYLQRSHKPFGLSRLNLSRSNEYVISRTTNQQCHTFGAQIQFGHELPDSIESPTFQKYNHQLGEYFETCIDSIGLPIQRHGKRPVLAKLFRKFRNNTPEKIHLSQFLVLAAVHDGHGRLKQGNWKPIGSFPNINSANKAY